MQSVYDAFNASVSKIARYQAPQTWFEKLHVVSLDIRTPILVSILYVLVVSYFSRLNRAGAAQAASSGKRASARGKPAAEEPRFTPFKCLVIAHNVLLCAYSAFTFISVVPILLKPYLSSSLLSAFCDVDKSIYKSGVNFWVWNFYMSKYYELADTAILLLKGKPSSFLQTFHHSGSIIGMWIMTITHAPAAWIFVVFNSFIHTIMYAYYTLTCFGYRPSWKKLLTTMQIIQFLVGNPLGIIYAFLPGCFPPEILPPENIVGRILGSQARSLYACLVVNTVFIGSLVVLFTDFSRKTYGKSEKAVKAEKVEKVDKPKKTEKVEKVEKAEKAEKAKKTEKVEKPKKAKKAEAERPVEKTVEKSTEKPKKSSKSKSESKSKSKASASRSRSRPATKKRSD